MKLRKTVKIDDKEITIRELTVRELMCIAAKVGWIPSTPETKIKDAKNMSLPELVCSFVTDVSVPEIMKLAPSEIEILSNTFLEVNASSLSFAKYMGFDVAFEQLRGSFLKDITGTYQSVLADT